MKDYQVSYCIGSMFHTYIIEAENEEQARIKLMKSAPYPELLQDIKIERRYTDWN